MIGRFLIVSQNQRLVHAKLPTHKHSATRVQYRALSRWNVTYIDGRQWSAPVLRSLRDVSSKSCCSFFRKGTHLWRLVLLIVLKSEKVTEILNNGWAHLVWSFYPPRKRWFPCPSTGSVPRKFLVFKNCSGNLLFQLNVCPNLQYHSFDRNSRTALDDGTFLRARTI